MGHVHLGISPATKRWQQVVGLVSAGASVEQIAGSASGERPVTKNSCLVRRRQGPTSRQKGTNVEFLLREAGLLPEQIDDAYLLHKSFQPLDRQDTQSDTARIALIVVRTPR